MALPKVGDRAQDKITGFRGTITAEIRYLERGRRSYCLEGIDSVGKPAELWVSNARIESGAAPLPEPTPSNDDDTAEG